MGVLEEFASEIGAEIILQGFWIFKKPKVVAKVQGWTITVEERTATSDQYGSTTSTATHMSARYARKDDFSFFASIPLGITKTGYDEGEGYVIVELTYPEIQLSVLTNDESKVRRLFANARIRDLFKSQPAVIFDIEEPGQLELIGPSPKVQPLKPMLELLVETLNGLSEIGSASKEDPSLSR